MTALPDAGSHTAQAGNAGTGPAPGRAAGSAGHLAAADGAVRAMLEARSVALVGASPRPGTFGSRMLAEVRHSSARPAIYPVNPRYDQISGARCYRSLADLPEAPDLALLAVPDTALEGQLTLAASLGSRGAVVFGNAHEDVQRGAGGPVLRERLATIARDAGMALCGAGCMGFVNVSGGLRAIGYTEPDPVRAGPVALVTHSGSVFSAMLRAPRGFGFTLAVSSGQELVTTAAQYAQYALDQASTGVLALVLEAIRDGARLRAVLSAAADRDIPVVLLTAGGSAGGRAMVAAHSGALAGSDGGWEALARAYGVHRVSDLAEFADTIELFAARRRPSVTAGSSAARSDAAGTGTAAGAAGAQQAAPTAGIATVHDSGLERAHVVDLAEELGVPFAEISAATTARLAGLLDPGLTPANPLDVWGTGADTRHLFGGCLQALADDPAVKAVVLAIDLVHELDGDDSYPLALLDTAGRTAKPLAVLSNLGSVIDPLVAGQLRDQGIPVLEGTRSGLLALRHLIDHDRQERSAAAGAAGRAGDNSGCRISSLRRSARAAGLLAGGSLSGAPLFSLLADYGIESASAVPAANLDETIAAAAQVGYPLVLKTDQPQIAHKSDVGGVVPGIASEADLAAAYRDLAGRLGPRVLVCQTIPAGTELALGIVTDPQLGPLIVLGAGGVLVELLADRAVALPPVSEQAAGDLLAGLRVSRLLAGARGAAPADLAAITRAIVAVSDLALDLGDQLEALDINPLICGPDGATAVDALAVPRVSRGEAG
jgi:acetate---CoA ligase (ADP-forming)